MNTKKIRILSLLIVGVFTLLIIVGWINDGSHHLTETGQIQSAALYFIEGEYNCAGEADLVDDVAWIYEETENTYVFSDIEMASDFGFSNESGLMNEYILNIIESIPGNMTVGEAKDLAPFHIALPSILPEGFDSSNAFARLSGNMFSDGEMVRSGVLSIATVTYLIISDSLASPHSLLRFRQRTSEPELFDLKLDTYYRMALEIGHYDVMRIEVNGLNAVLVTRKDFFPHLYGSAHISDAFMTEGRIFWHNGAEFFELCIVVPTIQFDLGMFILTAESIA